MAQLVQLLPSLPEVDIMLQVSLHAAEEVGSPGGLLEHEVDTFLGQREGPFGDRHDRLVGPHRSDVHLDLSWIPGRRLFERDPLWTTNLRDRYLEAVTHVGERPLDLEPSSSGRLPAETKNLTGRTDPLQR
jgi:hypothetical protein